ncbi:hypothetical protein TNCV_1577881 [Trichonephila clavipes]|nr:hypothetical protein TNCV_1577881 [Trichonephila clavipes]
MAEAANDLGYTFHWTIVNPTALLLRSTNFQSIGANLLINDGHFSRFHLKFSQRSPGGHGLVFIITYHSNQASCIANIKCTVLYGQEVISSLERNDVEFSQTRYFEIPLTVPLIVATHVPKCLRIECNINPNIGQNVNELRHAHEFMRSALRVLSYEMKDLLKTRVVPNLRIVCRGGDGFYNVNSFILKKRWSTLFEIHDIQDENLHYTISTIISRKVLWSILLFVYSSIVEYSALKFTPENSELAQLVHFYDLLQLHTVYAPHRRYIDQLTTVSLEEETREAKLGYETEINEEIRYRYLFTVGESPNSQIIYFDIYEKSLGNMGRWLSYRISTHESANPISIVVEITAKVEGTRILLYRKGYDLVIPLVGIRQDYVLFLGSRETFFDLLENNELDICIKILYSNGRASNVIEGQTDINETDCDLRYDLLRKLSDDMGEMYDEGYHASCQVVSSKTPETDEQEKYFAHQPILYTRVLYWRSDDTRLYHQRTCRLPVEQRALPAILRYIYTGILEVSVLEDDVLEAIRQCYEVLELVRISDYLDDDDSN